MTVLWFLEHTALAGVINSLKTGTTFATVESKPLTNVVLSDLAAKHNINGEVTICQKRLLKY